MAGYGLRPAGGGYFHADQGVVAGKASALGCPGPDDERPLAIGRVKPAFILLADARDVLGVEGVDPNNNCDRRVLYDRWKKPGDRVFFKNIALQENVSDLTTRFVQDYNYFQIGSISVGYDMKRDICRKIGLAGLRFNFNMSDVARFSSVKEERGLSYPFSRQFIFSLSANL